MTVTDATRDVDLFAFGEIDADAYHQSLPPDPVYGNIAVSVVNGGDSKNGSLRLLLQT